jgi:rhodanese-related sulfurtransferase
MKKLFIAITSVFFVFFYAGISLAIEGVTPTEAYYLAGSDANVYILDVRTAAEWEWVGHPGENRLGEGHELTGKVVHIPYRIDHKGSRITNPSFLSDVNGIFGESPDVTLILMCRSGDRSLAAAKLLTEEGYGVLNMLTGFEGGIDSRGYRNTKGWKNEHLPYQTNRNDIYQD